MIVGLVYPAVVLTRTFKSSLRNTSLDDWLNLSLAGALILSSWSVFLQRWTYDNGFMPACVGLGLLLGLGLAQMLKWTQQSRQHLPKLLVFGGTVFLLVVQFYLLRYSFSAQLPTDRDRQAGEKFIADLSRLPGQVFVFDQGFVNHLAGKSTFLHSTSYSDAVGGGSSPPRTEDNRWRREKVRQTFEQSVTQQRFEWVIVNRPETSWLPYYLYASPVFTEPDVYFPVTGVSSRPESLMIKNPVAQGGSFPFTDANLETLLVDGWSSPENWGRWAMGQRAAIKVALETDHSYAVVIKAFPFCPPSFEGQTIEVKWDDVQLGSYAFLTCEERTLTFSIPAESINRESSNLSFEFGQALSPANLGLSSDQRPLAVGFRSLTFVQE
jgi:hypothetical protein